MLRHLSESMGDAVATAGAADGDPLSLPTPCPEWDVRALLDHVTGGNRFTVDVLAGHDGQQALDRAMASFDDEHVPLDAIGESCNRQLDAFNRPGVLEGTYQHLFGELSGDQVLRLRLHDLGMHLWDLQQALGSTTPMDSTYAGWAIAELADPESLTAQTFATGASRPATSADLLVAFGRAPITPMSTR